MLSNAVLTCLMYFGTFGYNNENPSFINNRLQFDNYYDINMTVSGEVAHYHDRFLVDCDFALVPNENDSSINDVYVAFKSFTYQWYTISNTGDNETLANTYTDYFINFDDCVLNDFNNYWTLERYSYSQSGNYSYWYTLFSYYDAHYDESCGINPQNSTFNPAGPYALDGTFRSNAYKVDLDYIDSSVRNAFNMALGGYNQGYNQGYADGERIGKDAGYGTGYADGYTEGVSTNGTAFTIFNGILGIGMLPINVFLAMLNWEVFGINISNFVMSIMTLAITIWVISTFTGKKEGKK